jgi:hypothetical protein
MVAVVPHGLEDLPQPLIVGNVITDQVGVAHITRPIPLAKSNSSL